MNSQPPTEASGGGGPGPLSSLVKKLRENFDAPITTPRKVVQFCCPLNLPDLFISLKSTKFFAPLELAMAVLKRDR